MHDTDRHARVYRRPSEGEDECCCCCMAVICSLIDLIPLLCFTLVNSKAINEPPPTTTSSKFASQHNQTWSQFFSNCSYQLNSDGNYSIVCDPDFEPVSIVALTAVLVLGLALLLFNMITVTRRLTRNELIIRTAMHIIYALILFTTALIRTLTRDECSNCRVFVFLCSIPFATTLCMTYNWYDTDEYIDPNQQRPIENQPFELRPRISTHLSIYSGRIVSNETSLSMARCPPENSDDPRLENEFNEWLEAQQRRSQ